VWRCDVRTLQFKNTFVSNGSSNLTIQLKLGGELQLELFPGQQVRGSSITFDTVAVFPEGGRPMWRFFVISNDVIPVDGTAFFSAVRGPRTDLSLKVTSEDGRKTIHVRFAGS
jgi:hypothetical protein